MTEPLVVRYRPEARADFARRSTQERVSRGRAAIGLSVLVALLVLVPFVVVNATQGFEAVSLLLLLVLVPLPLLAWWGRERLRAAPAVLDEVAFVVGDDEIRFAEQPSAAATMQAVPAESWPTAGTTAQVRPSAALGEHLELHSADGRRRAYPTEMLELPAPEVAAQVTERAQR
ncbi:hypothetical protein KIN34_00510 [Cellulomonas sp. DKR-3]|uniref:Integral membrane protein n=1 Tax=Cellulomonas fulva TaxID=2835530 RepID=A0ABS5TUF6_9CELL|nr:hypothetical protein [Cellulomonas fulva]MBT0992772.1 hypothetical protein [Cellulomonas fulva]